MKNDILKKNEIYNRQLAILIMSVGLLCKVSRLPRFIVEYASDMVFLVELLFCIVEILIFLVIYFYISMDGLQLSKDNCIKPLKFLLGLLLIPLTFKFFLVYASVSIYIVSTMFRAIPSYIIICSLMLPLFFLAYKGIVTIARTTEVLFWFIFLLIIFGLVFYDAEMDITRLLPIVRADFSELSSGMLNLGVWVGDLLPFMLLKLKKRKFPYLAVAVPLNYILVMIYVILAVATFGSAIFIVENIFVYIPIFNSFSVTLGELQWAGLVAWIFMALLYMACLLWAIFDIGELLSKKRSIFAGIYSVAMVIFMLSFKTLEQGLSFLRTPYVGAICWASFTVLPLALLFLALYAKKKKNSPQNSKQENTEQPSPALEQQQAQNIGAKNQAEQNNTASQQPANQQNSTAMTPISPDLKQFVLLDTPQKGENS
ncbi:MAG TPA: GerAB/ArcD/ProY family transporter [Clostridia bacterium]|nr:GerAB/ArcD/ProY family transporter [Clostridia bacterium]